VYLVAESTGKDELYSAPIDGSAAPVKLNGTLPSGGGVLSFLLSPDGARVLYLADQSVNGRFELWSVPTDRSSAPVRVNGTLVTGGDVSESGASPLEPSFGISPDGTRAVYLADQNTDGVVELYSAPSAGVTNDEIEVFASPLDGSGLSMKLNPPLPWGWMAARRSSSTPLCPPGETWVTAPNAASSSAGMECAQSTAASRPPSSTTAPATERS
jgi:hypothetical protein